MNLIHTVYQPAGEGLFPTILTLHGRGANAMDLLGLAPYLCGGKLLMICPQGALETPIGPGVTGYAWYPMSMGGPPDVDAILSTRERIESFMAECLGRYPIDPGKTALLGFSQGGVMAYSLALTRPEHFAALAVLSSWLPKELQARLQVSEAVRALPTLVQHGTQDSLIEIDRTRDSAQRLRQLKLPLTFREYDMGHEITPRSLRDLSAWLEEKVLAPAAVKG
ncbi:MAG TPA: alpha/beta hydrolase-fold protein [Candidatus Binatia bacterium]|jgi:phospholipase/carboxylesterase